MKKLRHHLFILGFILAFVIQASGQVSIISSTVNSYNITSSGLFNITILNQTSSVVPGWVEVFLANSNQALICSGKSLPFQIKPGLNSIGNGIIQIGEFSFGSSPQASYVKSTHILPSGIFNYCVRLHVEGNIEVPDEYCLDLESAYTSFLDLASPFDKEVIETKYPILVWTHSESFSLLSGGEFFRVLLTEIKDDQGPESAITANQPIFIKDYLIRHDIPYPLAAPELVPEKRYAWQVQKISHGVIVQKTEAWEFSLPTPEIKKPHQYVELTQNDAIGIAEPEDDMLYFSFSEIYSGGIPQCRIYDSHMKLVEIQPSDDNKEPLEGVSIQRLGENRFALDLRPLDLKKGMYYLEVENVKSEIMKLKFRML